MPDIKSDKYVKSLNQIEEGDNSRRKKRGLIRYVLMIVSHPSQPSTPQMSQFLLSILPEFKAQKDGTAKVGLLWETESMNLINLPKLAIETFGNGITNSDKYTYRTIHFGITGGEAKCFVVYDIKKGLWPF